mgnify:CR=1 FL=1
MRKIIRKSAKAAVKTAFTAGAVVGWTGVVGILYLNMLRMPINRNNDFYF